MFNWTTTTIVNDSAQIPIYNEDTGKLRMGKYLFEKRWVESIRKATGHNPEICKAEIDMTAVKTALGDAKVARLYLYVGLEGSEESIYANDWYRKGMPLSVSFTNDTAENMVANIVDTVNRFNVFTKVKKVLEVSAKKDVATTLVIKGTHEYQRLQKIKVLIDAGDGEETAVVNYEMNHKADTAVPADDLVLGVNGFGTYSQLIKDLRLPTAEHNHWLSVHKEEMPIVGALYTQYIINYYAPSLSNPSFTSVGNRSMSATTHVFWVKSDLVEAFETSIAAIDPDGGDFETVVVKADSRFNNTQGSLLDRVEDLEAGA